ncbi:MAG: phage tail protein [Candidatus Wallbacteria bacterium]|nr:phage tail protein [Candidatus Wallbacteria bacterium]
MADPFVGEIRVFSFDLEPPGWAKCDGRTLSIQQHQALYSLIGTMFGGDGKSNFMLPDLRGRVPAGTVPTPGFLGKAFGAESITLTASEVAAHTHSMMGTSSNGTQRLPLNTPVLANAVVGVPPTPIPLYRVPGPTSPVVAMAPGAVSQAGESQAHPNVQPSLALNFCIALTGSYPPRS